MSTVADRALVKAERGVALAAVEENAALVEESVAFVEENAALVEETAAQRGVGAVLSALLLARRFLADLPPGCKGTLRGRWYPHTPALADALAEMLKRCPAPFVRLPFGADDLRGEHRRIRDLETARAATAELLADLDRELSLRKLRLAERAALLVSSVRAQLGDPLGAPGELKAAAAKALAILDAFHKRGTKTRRRMALLREAEAADSQAL